MQLHNTYPELNLVVQDKEPVIQQALSVWETKYPAAIQNGKVKLAGHDFFEKNPVHGAKVYWMRHIMYAFESALQSRMKHKTIANIVYIDTTGPTMKQQPS
jgi:hypothetical protein